MAGNGSGLIGPNSVKISVMFTIKAQARPGEISFNLAGRALDLTYFSQLPVLWMFEQIYGTAEIFLSFFFCQLSHLIFFHAACCCGCYQRSVVERLCPGQREGDWAARCCRSPWQSPGTLSRSMACAYWLNGTEKRRDRRGFGLNGAITRNQCVYF